MQWTSVGVGGSGSLMAIGLMIQTRTSRSFPLAASSFTLSEMALRTTFSLRLTVVLTLVGRPLRRR
jgi:hypothetical protein